MMKLFYVVLFLLVIQVSYCQSPSDVNRLYRKFFDKENSNIKNHLSAQILVYDSLKNTRKTVSAEQFRKKYYIALVRIYEDTDFVVSKDENSNVMVLLNHCNRHYFKLSPEGKIEELVIQYIYKRDSKLFIPDCK